MPRGMVLDDKKAQVLGEAVRRVLKESGVWVHHPRMLEALAEKGAGVEAGSKHVRLTDELIDEVLALQKARGLVEAPASLEAASTYSVSMGFEITPLYYDFDAGKPRHPTQADLESMVKLAQRLPEVTTVGAPLTLVGSSALFEPLESFLTVARLTDKPIS
ncbi:MAG: trimethylamine methyltransferase family protein, partial [Armatimonadia bacterium]